MSLYTYADLTLLSELQLDTFLATRNGGSDSSPDFIIHLFRSPPAEPPADTWLQHWHNDKGDLTLSLALAGDRYLLRFPSLVDFVIFADGYRIGVWPKQEADSVTLQHLLLDQVLPRVLGEKGLLVLHASAVSCDAGILAFAGQTGHGKSTLAASLHAAGLTAICDDGLVISPGDSCSTAIPVYPGMRLWSESMTAVCPDGTLAESTTNFPQKHRILIKEQGASKPSVLAAIYFLSPPQKRQDRQNIYINRIRSRKACIEIMRNSFRLHLNSTQKASDLLANTARIVSQLPIFMLNYPREYSRLSDVHTAILQHSKKQTESL